MKQCNLVFRILLITILILTTSPVLLNAQTQFSRTNVPGQITITASSANVRSGPSTTFLKVGIVYQGQIIECIGKLGGWWVVHLQSDVVGAISADLAKAYYPPNTTPTTPAPVPTPSTTVQLSADQQHMLDLINQERSKAGVSLLKIDSQLQKMAQVKSDEMVAKSYFSHTSPTYGSPFEMMKTFGISYTSAGENIAGNSSVDAAHAALMNSPDHKANLLNPSFSYVGIGITASPTYGKMFAQDFIGR
ncbi:CAP domain-containing protein [Desulfosporosinus sp. Sb-LF]|uniref:CAP domain-containing protein n=1 Tax=Desulfosporosinus sp. Sb-LF TaxID=2560027 RepID=UPI00107F31D0|nr:CAP domain-containing protein [Desulfosporosinus sp. Sb-LF]TGE33595.1 serine protease [Desulfosporosinus sp. Sb-LF]